MHSRVEPVLPDAAFQRLSQASSFMFDVDRTLADPHDALREEIVSELVKLRAPAGVATARTLSELEDSLPAGRGLTDIFRGDLLLEDGGVVVKGGQERGSPLRLEALVSQDELGAITEFIEFLRHEFVDLKREDGFGMFRGLPEPLVKFPPFHDFLTSITIWEKGPVGDPTFALAYQWLSARIRERGLTDTLALTEVGDGTLRVTVPMVNKGWGLERLAERGRLDLSRVAYFGDGANDIPAAAIVKAHGGLVLSVGASTPALVSLADYRTHGEGPDSVMKVLRRLDRMTR